MSDNDLRYYSCYTLFDIGSVPTYGSNTSNWQTAVQLISLRAQPLVLDYPKMITANLGMYSFGSKHKGLHRVWQLRFGIAPTAFRPGEDPVTALMADCDMVPMITGLGETAHLDVPCMQTAEFSRNTYFQESQ